jgi:hypothetical protein
VHTTVDRASSPFATSRATSQLISKSTIPRRDPRDGDESPYNRSSRNLLEMKLRSTQLACGLHDEMMGEISDRHFVCMWEIELHCLECHQARGTVSRKSGTHNGGVEGELKSIGR